MYVALTLLLNILGFVAIAVMVPLGMWLVRDPSRDAEELRRAAGTAWERGHEAQALRLLSKATPWRRSGRYGTVHAQRARDALDRLAAWVTPLPEPLARFRAALPEEGEGAVSSEIVAAAREAMSDLAEDRASGPPVRS